ncbi:MAG: serine/threonine-protein phosphatase [Gammaproteobacteria bacterium]|jgi:serine/threonine protein phosphatase PrpC
MTRFLDPIPQRLICRDGGESPISGVMTLGTGAAAFYSSPHPGGIGPNQDALALIPLEDQRAVIAVADGMGGLPGGREAAALAVSTLSEALSVSPSPDENSSRTQIIDAIEQANDRILATGLGAATTIAIAELGPDSVRSYHVGDSEIIVFGQRGQTKLQSVPHSPVGFALHSGILDENQAISHEDRHLVSNALGNRDMRIEIGSPVPLAPFDTVVLCSDGLVDNLQSAEICCALRRGRLDRSLKRMVGVARQRMTEPLDGEPSKADDISVIAYRRCPGAAVTRLLRNVRERSNPSA